MVKYKQDLFYDLFLSVYMLQFRVEMMDSFVKLAKYRYECGNYSVSTSYLYFYMLIMPPSDKVQFLTLIFNK